MFYLGLTSEAMLFCSLMNTGVQYSIRLLLIEGKCARETRSMATICVNIFVFDGGLGSDTFCILKGGIVLNF